MNTAEGPNTTSPLSKQFIVKCSVRGHHVYKCIWSPCVDELLETFCEEDYKHDKYAVAVHLNNCLTVVGHIPREIQCNTHLPLLHKEQRGITGEAEDDSTAQQLVEV